MKQGKEVFEMLEVYDRTREWPIGREKLYITLSKKIIQKLKELSAKTGTPISRIIEESILKI
ncbi:MAG: ribbon-helix-helix domain-containing protein [Nanoarchaeota archaeon]|nr:ribbon-helix-helix domain-containing protein [Nanoarchaeota archaeon]